MLIYVANVNTKSDLWSNCWSLAWTNPNPLLCLGPRITAIDYNDCQDQTSSFFGPHLSLMVWILWAALISCVLWISRAAFRINRVRNFFFRSKKIFYSKRKIDAFNFALVINKIIFQISEIGSIVSNMYQAKINTLIS